MKVTTMGGRSTGKTMAQLKQDNDALKEQLSFLAARVATLNEFCQANNIGEWGDSVVSAVIKHCEGLAAQNAELAATVGELKSSCQLAIDMFKVNDINVPNTIETLEDAINATPTQCLRQIQTDEIRDGFIAGAKYVYTSRELGYFPDVLELVSLDYVGRVKAGEV